MTTPNHQLIIYPKPRESSSVIRATYPAYQYKHKLTWHGGDDTASCTLAVTQSEAEFIFKNYIGNIVAFHVDNPTEPIFEGFINSIVYEVGGFIFRRSFDNMANRVNVTYYNADSAAAQKTEITTTVNNTVSQGIYGIKTMNLDAGVHYNNADKTHKTTLGDTILSVMAWPQVSVASRAGGGVLLSLEIKGLYYYAWDWEIYHITSGFTENAVNAFISTAVGGAKSVNSGYIIKTFPTAGYASYIASNLAFGISLDSKTGQTFLQYLQSLVEAGDGVNEWVYGITHKKSDGYRYAYYRAASTDVIYHTKALGKPGEIQDVYGRVIPAWKIRPDNGIQITDVLAGFENQMGDDPRTSYIKFIEYEADTQLVSWQSSDDATLEGEMNLRKYFKPHGERFGAGVRPLV